MSRYYDDETSVDTRRDNDDSSTFYTETMDDRTEDAPARPPSKNKNDGIQLTEEITNDLKEFIDLCGQIKAAKEEIKVLADRKVELEDKISQFMIEHGIPAFNTPNGMIKSYPATTVKPLNKEYLRETLSSKLQDARIVEELTTLAFQKRPSTSVHKIKVIPKRDR